MATSLVFPPDIRSTVNYPFVQFQITKFRETTLLKDLQGSSAIVDKSQQQQAANNAFVSSLGGDMTNYGPPGTTDMARIQAYQSQTAPTVGTSTAAANATPYATIYLPLPSSVQNTYNPSWDLADNIIGSTAIQAMNAATAKDGALTLMKGIGTAALAQTLYAQKFAALTPNPKKQAVFNGIEPRSFSFDYTFSPQSLQEAQTVASIIQTFSYSCLPQIQNATDFFFGFPYEFNITFVNTQGFPKISWCVCNGMTTNYSPNTMQLLRDGYAVQITLSMSFLETSLRTNIDPGI